MVYNYFFHYLSLKVNFFFVHVFTWGLRTYIEGTLRLFFSYQHDLVSLDNLEYSYHDQTMSEIGLTPSEVELTIPSFVLRDRAEEIEYWDDQMKQAMTKMGTADVAVICYCTKQTPKNCILRIKTYNNNNNSYCVA